MSRPGPTATGDDLGLTAADIDRALSRSLVRGGQLVRRRNQRRTALGGLAVVALFAGGFGVITSLSDDASPVVVTPAGSAGDQESGPASSTTKATSVPTTTPPPYLTGHSDQGINFVIYTGPDDQTTIDAGGGVMLGGAVAIQKLAPVRSATVIDPGLVRVEFECVRNTGDRLETAHYFLEGTVLHLDATVSGDHAGTECIDGVGLTFDLPYEGDLPPEVTVVVEDIEPSS